MGMQTLSISKVSEIRGRAYKDLQRRGIGPRMLADITISDVISLCDMAMILCRVARGEIDLNELASAELAGRGMDEQGRWVGFEQAQALHKVRAFTGYDEMLAIAQRELGIETLEARKSDDLDFHDLSVWQIRAALIAAYKAGLRATL